MVVQDSRSEYESRMHRVLECIDQRLDEPLDLHTLAAVAHFSPFYFHRLFLAWMGETLGDYRRRRRVEVAAMRLAAQPRLTVLQVALSVGFGSAEAFTRAFGARFGRSPTAWRRQQALARSKLSNPDQANGRTDQAWNPALADHDGSYQPEPEHAMQVRIIDRKPVTVAYLRNIGPYGADISRFWHDAYFPWAVTHNLIGSARYGISHDDPGITAPAQCRYDACAEVPDDFVATGNAHKTILPGGKYAALRFRGTGEKIEAAWTALLRDWLPDSGMQLDARPSFEYYPTDACYDPDTGEFECDICVPVVPL